jgi:hypothetical protein
MTTQAPELFAYRGQTYLIMGIQGGSLIPIEELIVPIDMTGQSTGLYRGYQGTYAVNEHNRLILKTAHDYRHRVKTVNQDVPMTGYILFSNVGDPLIMGAYAQKIVEDFDKFIIFEAEIVEGVVVDIKDCTADVRARLKTLPPEVVDPFDIYEDREIALYKFWDWTTLFLPRRYDILMMYVNYFHFPSRQGL